MPLSKKKDAVRKLKYYYETKKIRLEGKKLPTYLPQYGTPVINDILQDDRGIDADGNPIPEY